jgi:hypothetical protein
MFILTSFSEIPLETKKEIVNSYLSNNTTVSMIHFNYNISFDTLYKILKSCGIRPSRKKPRKPIKSPARVTHSYHNKLVNEYAQKYQTPTNTVLNFNKRPIPDILIINWENRTITGVEVETPKNHPFKQDFVNNSKLQLYTNPKTKKPINNLIIASPTDSKEYNLTT